MDRLRTIGPLGGGTADGARPSGLRRRDRCRDYSKCGSSANLTARLVDAARQPGADRSQRANLADVLAWLAEAGPCTGMPDSSHCWSATVRGGRTGSASQRRPPAAGDRRAARGRGRRSGRLRRANCRACWHWAGVMRRCGRITPRFADRRHVDRRRGPGPSLPWQDA